MTTASTASSTVVNRLPHFGQDRRRQMSWPSSASRESTTRESACRQYVAAKSKSGVQVDSSVAHQVSRRYITADTVLLQALVGVVGRLWSSFAGPATAQTAQRRPRLSLRL
ncbi:hypothetical protein [Micromonospora sp. NPDC003776]